MTDVPQPNVYQQFAATLAKTEWFSRHQLELYREKLLARLAKFAWSHSPFYRERLQPLFRGSDEPQLESWGEVPLLRRSDLESDIGRINPDTVPEDVGEV